MTRARSARHHGAFIVLVVLSSAFAMGACSRAVDVPPASTGRACADFVKSLPATVDGAARRAVTPTDSGTAAWGDPAITLRCGVPVPPAAPGTSLLAVNGVDWLPQELSAGYRFTTRTAIGYVSVDVPGRYSPESDALVDLAPALAAHAIG